MVVSIAGVGQGVSELLQAVIIYKAVRYLLNNNNNNNNNMTIFAANSKLNLGFPDLGEGDVALRECAFVVSGAWGVSDFLQIALQSP